MDRRQFLAGNAAAGLIVSAPASLANASGSVAALADEPQSSQSPGIDRDRAAHVMRALSLDALVLSRAENVLYTTRAEPVTSKLGFTDASFAIVPADPKLPVAILVYQFPFYYSVADIGMAAGVEPHLVASGPSPEPFFLANDPAYGPSSRELNRRSVTLEAGPIHPDFSTALKAALPRQVWGSGTIGFDTTEAFQLIEQAAPGATAVSGESAIRHMRLIKTDWEITAMSRAAQVNREAAHLAAQSIRAGDTIGAVQKAFFNHAINLGNRPEFMVVDGVITENYADPVRDGTSVLIDCVSSRDGYHGDYGRTVFLGEPRKEIASKAKAVGAAWAQLRNELKPGMKFSEVSARGSAILSSINSAVVVPFGPHSVGLKHTEQPGTGLDGAPLDIMLEPGMIISVDCPLMESSLHGTVHLEDLMLITSDGAKPIHSVDDQIIIV